MSASRRPAPSQRRPSGQPQPATSRQPAAKAAPTDGGAKRAVEIAMSWTPLIGRVLLGLVLAWFGYHELVRPALWTGYVPILSATSSVAVIAVLAHGWLLLVLAVALIVGVAPRAAAAVAAILLVEIVISLTVTGGLSDLTLRDVGVLGLAVLLTGVRQERLVLSS